MPISPDLEAHLARLEPVYAALSAVITDLRERAAKPAEWTAEDKATADAWAAKLEQLAHVNRP